MECVGTGCKQNARVDCDLEIKMQNLPCFDKNLCFGVLEGLRTCKLVFLA